MKAFGNLRALLFDVFGTVVDWRGSILKELGAVANEQGVQLPAAEMADDWRGRYGPSMDEVLNGDAPYRNLDELHRGSLLELLEERGLELPPPAIDRLVAAWPPLEPWPRSVAALTRRSTS